MLFLIEVSETTGLSHLEPQIQHMYYYYVSDDTNINTKYNYNIATTKNNNKNTVGNVEIIKVYSCVLYTTILPTSCVYLLSCVTVPIKKGCFKVLSSLMTFVVVLLRICIFNTT